MLLLESVLEHGTTLGLSDGTFFLMENFTSVLLKILASVCPALLQPEQSQGDLEYGQESTHTRL